MAKKLIIILGAGPGLGRAMSTVFAEKGFSIALLSRNAERLKQDVDLIHQTNPRCEARFYPVDVGDHIALKQVLDEVYADLGPPEVVYFNAARVQPSRIGQASPEYILDDFKVVINLLLY
jgi:NAD(P)-dependent dehydrogenase (short-subunit alcohol dehydrogenase family)